MGVAAGEQALRWTPEVVARASGCLHSWLREIDHPTTTDPLGPASDWIDQRLFLATLEGIREAGRGWASRRAAVEGTRALLSEGADWVHRPYLAREPFEGRPLLLKKIPAGPAPGGGSYAPVERIELEKPGRRDHVLLLVDAHLLEPFTGAAVEVGFLGVRGSSALHPVPLARYRGTHQRTIGNLRWVQEERPLLFPLRNRECAACPWWDECRRHWIEERHVSLLHEVGGTRARRLMDAGLSTYDAVGGASVERLAEVLRTERAIAEHVRDQARAWIEGGMVVRSAPRWPREGVWYCYDVETYGSVVYLHGWLRVDADGGREERQFLARSPLEERAAWRGFLETVACSPEGPIYAWSGFDRSFAEALWRRHGGSASGYERLMRRLTDLQALTLRSFALPVTGYGLKEVARFIGLRWRTPGAGGTLAGEWYDAWLHEGDEEALRKVCAYNADDLAATARIREALAAAAVPP